MNKAVEITNSVFAFRELLFAWLASVFIWRFLPFEKMMEKIKAIEITRLIIIQKGNSQAFQNTLSPKLQEMLKLHPTARATLILILQVVLEGILTQI